ncbi:trypsin-like serine protease [Hyphomonas sp. BRH_c22]|uniref:S1 family peptidase n=1 Tax=Hyphomonas sp. BRH_c22 TaxID=1629710 RepID=UPI000A745843|nr:trypsin-like serine protease [Hyphomonas sp. BRH_c22]
MKRKALLAASAALLVLSACDAIRVPGVNPSDAETQTQADEEASAIIDQLPADAFDEDSASSVEVVPETPAVIPASELPETAPAETPPATDDTAPAEAVPSDGAATDTPDEALLQPESAGGLALNPQASLPTLAALNASTCVRPSGSPPTPTVASVSGATSQVQVPAGTEAVNGLAASLASFPGIVKLEPRSAQADGRVASGHCGATRIARNWFVTAAHCVDDDYEELRLIGDAANLRSPLSKVTRATLAVCHGGYLGTINGYANDLALIRLDEDQIAPLADVPVARYGATEKPLAPANYPTADMAGWGLTHLGGQLSNDLLATRLQITADGPSLINVASAGGAGPCVGDSGGPLYVTEADGSRTVVGVLSVVEQNRATGEFCAGEYNGRFTNLQGYMGWMDSVMALCDASPDACR